MPLPPLALIAAAGKGLLQASVSANLRAMKKQPVLVESFAKDLAANEGHEWRKLKREEKLVWMVRVGKMIDLMADGLDPAMQVLDAGRRMVDGIKGE